MLVVLPGSTINNREDGAVTDGRAVSAAPSLADDASVADDDDEEPRRATRSG